MALKRTLNDFIKKNKFFATLDAPANVEMEEWPREKEVSFNVNDKNYEGEVLMSNRTTGKVSVADTVDGGGFT